MEMKFKRLVYISYLVIITINLGSLVYAQQKRKGFLKKLSIFTVMTNMVTYPSKRTPALAVMKSKILVDPP